MERASSCRSGHDFRTFYPLREHFEQLLVPFLCLREMLATDERGVEGGHVLEALLRDLEFHLLDTADKLEHACGAIELCYFPTAPRVGDLRHK